MGSNPQPQTDLASILQTLRAYAPSQQQPPETPYQLQPQAPPQASDLEEGEYDPSTYDPSLPLITTPHPQIPHPQPPHPQTQQPPPPITSTPPIQTTAPTPDPQPAPPPKPLPPSTPSSHPPAPPKPHPPPSHHPSTLTTWPPALRHITNLASTQPLFLPQIQHLLRTQRTHERDWWKGRTTLLKTLSNRSQSRSKLNHVLNSLGGAIQTSSTTQTLDDEQSSVQEMKNYDRKVHKACVEMGEASSKELGKLGVPFFCIAPALVSERGDGRAEGKRRGTVSREELGVLRGRMVGLLEDLCGGEEDGEGVSE